MQTIQGFLARYSITTHVIVASLASLVGAYYAVPQFHALVLAIYAAFPSWLETLVSTGLALYFYYRSGLSTQGKLAVVVDSAKVQPDATVHAAESAKVAPLVATPTLVESASSKLVPVLLAVLGFVGSYGRLIRFAGMAMVALVVLCAMTGCASPTWLLDIGNIVPVLLASVGSILTLIGNATGNLVETGVGAALSAWAAKVQAGFLNIQQLVEEYKETPGETKLQEIEQVAATVVGDIGTFDTIIGVPAALSATLQKWAQFVLSQIEALVSVLPGMSAPAGTALSIKIPMNVKEIKAAHALILSAPTGDAATDALQLHHAKI